jgi:uncharacterized membrane protein
VSRGQPPVKSVVARRSSADNAPFAALGCHHLEGFAMNEVSAERAGSPDMAKIVYVLYLIGLLTGVTLIIGVVMAYIYRDEAPDWLRTHYDAQIRIFWIAILYSVIAGILIAVLIGILLFFAIAVWWIIRCVKGLKYLDQGVAYPNYQSWTF